MAEYGPGGDCGKSPGAGVKMMDTVLLCGEGSTDYGKPGASFDQWKEGPVQPLIRNSIERKISFKCLERGSLRDKGKRLQRKRPKVKGKGIQAFKLSIYAKENQYDKAILFSDADRTQTTKNDELQAKRQFKKVYDEIDNAFEYFREKYNMTLIPMVALRMIESWLLADENAFERCFKGKPRNPPLPPKQEIIWGAKDNPRGNHPKHVLRRVLIQYHQTPCRETFHEIAENIEVNMLRRNCPISYGLFYNDVQNL